MGNTAKATSYMRMKAKMQAQIDEQKAYVADLMGWNGEAAQTKAKLVLHIIYEMEKALTTGRPNPDLPKGFLQQAI